MLSSLLSSLLSSCATFRYYVYVVSSQMNTPMIGFRLDPQLTALMDARCRELDQTRAEFLRGLILAELGSPETVGGGSDGGKVAAEGADRFATIGEVDRRIDDFMGRLAPWTVRTEGSLLQLGDRLTLLERSRQNG